MPKDYHLRTTCRLCDSPVELLLELTPTPLANELVSKENLGRPVDLFPLPIAVCDACGHCQLLCVVDPKRLFKQYPYRSGATSRMTRHLEEYAADCIRRFGLHENDLVVEIGSNDGTFLLPFKDIGCRVLGVDPASNIVQIARERGVDTHCGFFDQTLAVNIRAFYNEPRLIVANHVFAHADDLTGIVEAVDLLLAPGGRFVFEVGYLMDVLEGDHWDVCYHEHTSLHHVAPLISFFERFGMFVETVERVDIQGGAIRVTVARGSESKIKNEAIGLDLRQSQLWYEGPRGDVAEKFRAMMGRVWQRRVWLLSELRDLKKDGARIAGYGAPAKAVTFLYEMGIGKEILDFVVDDSPLKQGLYLPGKELEIRRPRALYDEKVNRILILAWNFADEIKKRHPTLEGRWVEWK